MTEAAYRGISNLAKMMSGRLLAQAVLIASAFIIPRVLGVGSYGHYAAVMAVVVIAQTLSEAGLSLVEVRFLSPLVQSQDFPKASALGSTVWFTRLLLSVTSGLAAALWLGVSSELELPLGLVCLLGVLALLRGAFEATRGLLLPTGHVGKLSGFDLLRVLLTLLVVVTAYRFAGLKGIYVALPAMYAALLVVVMWVLLRVLPMSFSRFHWSSLRVHVGYSLRNWAGSIAAVVQSQFSVYAAANWISASEAGLLAFTLQVLALFQGLFLTAQGALSPLLAELADTCQVERLGFWGGLMMRYGAAGSVVATVGWVMLGQPIIGRLLTEDFAPVYGSVTVILVGATLYACAASANFLLFIRGSAGLAAANLGIYAGVTILGLALALRSAAPGAFLRISWVHALAAGAYFLAAYFSLAVAFRMWLPLRRTVLLILPLAVILPALAWQAPIGQRMGALVVVLVLYSIWALALGLLPSSEFAEIRTLIRGAGGHKT